MAPNIPSYNILAPVWGFIPIFRLFTLPPFFSICICNYYVSSTILSADKQKEGRGSFPLPKELTVQSKNKSALCCSTEQALYERSGNLEVGGDDSAQDT